MEINTLNIKDIVEGLGIKANKSLGQNFLVDPRFSKSIVDALEIKEDDEVLEIGPGLGSLTHYILNTHPLTAVDIDTRMIEFLSEQYEGDDKLTLINKDVLKLDLSKYTKIIGNLPYYITSDILTHVLLHASNVKKCVFMVQKEAYIRIASKIKEDGYSPLSILLYLLATPKRLFNVSCGAFYPNPHVDSLVFEINFDKTRNEAIIGTYFLVKSLFLNKRKTILNNLTNYLKDKTLAEEVLTSCSLTFNLRPEQISKEEYVKMYQTIKEMKEKK